MIKKSLAALALTATLAAPAFAADAPSEIKIGTLYASSGPGTSLDSVIFNSTAVINVVAAVPEPASILFACVVVGGLGRTAVPSKRFSAAVDSSRGI